MLLELGYLSNKRDEQLLASPSWRNEVSAAVAKAVDTFVKSAPIAGVANAPRRDG